MSKRTVTGATACVAVLLGVCVLVGCTNPPPAKDPPKPAQPAATADDRHGNSHEHGETGRVIATTAITEGAKLIGKALEPPVTNVSCDLRLVRASDGTVVAGATGQARREQLEPLAAALAGKLKEGVLVKGETVAVATLANRSGTDGCRVVADELADKTTGALVALGWFDVKERIGLRALLDEKELDSAEIVKNPKVQGRLAGVKFLVIGGVTVSETRP